MFAHTRTLSLTKHSKSLTTSTSSHAQFSIHTLHRASSAPNAPQRGRRNCAGCATAWDTWRAWPCFCRQCHGRSILVTSEATAESTETKHELSNEENVGECSECRGFEIVYKTTTAFITVPPGSVNELGQSRVFLQGAGHSQPGACPPGNVIVNFAVAASAAASKAKVPVQDTAQATPASAATIDWIRGHVNMKLLVSPDDASAGGRGESKWQRTITAPDGVTRLAVQGQGTELVEFGKHGVWAFDQVLASESAGASGSAALVASNGKQVGASRKAPTRGHLRVIPELDS
jgi:hypothetical protein